MGSNQSSQRNSENPDRCKSKVFTFGSHYVWIMEWFGNHNKSINTDSTQIHDGSGGEQDINAFPNSVRCFVTKDGR